VRAYWRLPETLQVAAYSAGSEYAWRRDHALLVIKDLEQRGCAVIGVEVWLATEPGPTIPAPGVYTWEAQPRRPEESWAMFVHRVNTDTAEYVRTFSWHPDDRQHAREKPYFNLTVVEEHDS
jgi:hypothetical protein